ncbi:MAG: flagellar basal body rod protein FlgC [Syntrophobacteraceae bacterium]|jgi:flagellar basal-body rod protein FlgC
MDLDSAIQISASGLKANRTWINVISANLANVNTTRTAEGVPYTRKTVIYETASDEGFAGELSAAMGEGEDKVRVSDIVPDQRDFKQVYDPGHPDANAKGLVLLPNINPVEEMANLMNASRSYEANLAALQTARQLALKSMDIGAK